MHAIYPFVFTMRMYGSIGVLFVIFETKCTVTLTSTSSWSVNVMVHAT